MTIAHKTSDATITHPAEAVSLGADIDRQRERLLALRAQLMLERERAISPAVARTLEMSDIYLFLALGYLGHTDELFPDETTGTTGHG